MFKRENRDEVVRLRVTTEEKEILKKFAKEKDLTMSAVIIQALINYQQFREILNKWKFITKAKRIKL